MDRGSQRCGLCAREVTDRTRHHLTPREVGGRHLPTVELCRTCHRQLHAMFDNRQLADLNTVARLRADPRVAAYLKWVRRRPGATSHRVRRSRRREAD